MSTSESFVVHSSTYTGGGGGGGGIAHVIASLLSPSFVVFVPYNPPFFNSMVPAPSVRRPLAFAADPHTHAKELPSALQLRACRSSIR